MADDPFTVTLTRIDVTHHSSTDTRIGVGAAGIDEVSVALGAGNKLWLSWDRTLVAYDPETGAIQRWPLPPLSNPGRASASRTAVVHPSNSPTDGRSIAMAISSDHEIWLVVHGVQAIFGFNPSTSSWDRMLPLPLLPVGPQLVAPKPGTLMVGGVNIQGHDETPRLALVDTTTGQVDVEAPKAWNFALVNRDEAVYLDASGVLGALNLTDGSTKTLAAVFPASLLAADGAGNVWFSLAGPAAGVGRLDLASGITTPFPFPFFKLTGTPRPAMCGGFGCGSSATPNSEVQGIAPDEIQVIAPDSHGNVWVVTTKNGSGDPYESTLASPVYVLSSVG
jgi:hypothetical protein